VLWPGTANIIRFYHTHHDRQGIAVLGFHVDNVNAVHRRYTQLHPHLIHHYGMYGSTSILEVYAYYEHVSDDSKEEPTVNEKLPDVGTLIRFVETLDDIGSPTFCMLPGLAQLPAKFDDRSRPAYFDHWVRCSYRLVICVSVLCCNDVGSHSRLSFIITKVSNVFSRTEFLSTLHDTLGFEPKVDFNAGVVAAGEAQIESTVTGNDSTLETSDKDVVLQDQSQGRWIGFWGEFYVSVENLIGTFFPLHMPVYLPINNALSPVGHVHGFLKEIGQGVQHIANRVENLVEFVSRCNDFREMSGEGFTFLQIPRSYYGVLSLNLLTSKAGISMDLATNILEVCAEVKIASLDGAVDLDISKDSLMSLLDQKITQSQLLGEYLNARDDIAETILASRYNNLYNLLRHHVSESTYLDLVKNMILCDVQGQDVLYQIFTCKILFKEPADEAPFFEFIQRVCSACESADGCPAKVKAGTYQWKSETMDPPLLEDDLIFAMYLSFFLGCGGFGIRNFLTLFLSIEVSKAMREVSDARVLGDGRREMLAQKKVACFTDQLNESNPILTQISDAMTDEGICLSNLKAAEAIGDTNSASLWKDKKTIAEKQKIEGNQKLMECSHRYEQLMRQIREESFE
jgi:hypothetical protein